MKISALDNKIVQEKAADLKRRSDKNMETSRLRDQSLTEARGTADSLKAQAMAAGAAADLVSNPRATSTQADPAAVVTTTPGRQPIATPDIIVGITRREPTAEEAEQAKAARSPQEIHSKARSLLQMNVLPPDQRKVLEEIITRQEMAERK